MVAKMASDAEKRINLTALQRRDPYITDILDSATQVALYTFNPTTNEWEKTEIEGTLFVYSRIAPPTFGFTIMNRLSMDNLTEPLGGDIDFQNQSPFLLYRNAKLNIYGIWFYDLYDCTRIGKLLVEKCEEAKKATPSSVPSANGNVKNNILPSPSSTGGSTTSSLSENAIEEDTASTVDNHIEQLAAKSNNTQSNHLMNILFKAKEDYDKSHGSGDNQRAQSQKSSTLAQLFQPIKTEETKKLNVSALFESSDNAQKASTSERPSSAEIFGKILPDNGNSELPRQRRPTRSMSLCLSNSGTPPNPEAPIRSIVNGAISVEELESPVLGASTARNRHHSVNEGALRNTASPKAAIETDSAFHKLLSKMAVSAKSSGSATSSPTPTDQQGITAQLLSGTKLASEPANEKVTRRQLSLSGAMDTKSYVRSEALNKMYSTSPSASFSATNILPAVPEQPKSAVIVKSMSVASGLSKLTTNGGVVPVNVSALHGTNELLSPDMLQSSLSEEQAMATSLGLLPSAKHKNLSNAAPVETKGSTPKETNGQQKNTVPAEGDKPTLISPDDFEHSTSNELRQRLLPQNSQDAPAPMDEKQLAEVLVHLLQTNNSFVNTIHKAYLSSLEQGSTPNDAGILSTAVWK